jgi:hypothetical protein
MDRLRRENDLLPDQCATEPRHRHRALGEPRGGFGGALKPAGKSPGSVAEHADRQAELLALARRLQAGVADADVGRAGALEAELGVVGAQRLGPLERRLATRAGRQSEEARIDLAGHAAAVSRAARHRDSEPEPKPATTVRRDASRTRRQPGLDWTSLSPIRGGSQSRESKFVRRSADRAGSRRPLCRQCSRGPSGRSGTNAIVR